MIDNISNYLDNFLYKLRSSKNTLSYNLEDWSKLINISTVNKNRPIINEKELRVVGLKRSGNHGIINWIWKQQETGVVHLNNVPVKVNPYKFLYHHFSTKQLQDECRGNFSKKRMLIYSYEDRQLADIANIYFEMMHDVYLGKTGRRYDVVILRDPFNWMASRIKMAENNRNNSRVNIDNLLSARSIDLWIAYAKEFLGETTYLKNHKICINYNRWCHEANYRKSLAESLGLNFSDADFGRVKPEGGGSSFDGLKFVHRATEMKVDRRWQHYTDNRYFLNTIAKPELLYYARLIFDKNIDIDEIVNSCQKTNYYLSHNYSYRKG